jgi:hypothetical protein
MDENTLSGAKALSAEGRKTLLSVSLRYNALFAEIDRKDLALPQEITPEVSAFLLTLSDKGYILEEDLLKALCFKADSQILEEITQVIDKALGIGLNWMPLVKGWTVPTGESWIDHCITFFANFFPNNMSGTTLPCGHFIPDGTFPLERYNGCPFCGTPFKTSGFVYKGQGSKKKLLRLMTLEDLQKLKVSLLESTVPLDAGQGESLRSLIEVFGFDGCEKVEMKETRLIVADALLAKAESDDDIKRVGNLFSSPADILRYLWYKKTGRLQIIEPKTLIAHAGRLNSHLISALDKKAEAAEKKKRELKLKYDRRMCRAVALWLNSLDMDAEQACEIMHPKRGMWVRMIRALRLGEYSRKPGYERLAKLLDTFYKDDYSVWKGQLDKCLGINCGCVDYTKALELLKQRPGTFARSLFAIMLTMGPKLALDAFRQIMDKVPPRLILSLANAADLYFDTEAVRIARPLTGSTKTIDHNKKLENFTPEQRDKMRRSVWGLYKEALTRRFKTEDLSKTNGKIFIDKALFDIPVSVGDRSASIQDASAALQGTRFIVEGDSVRLFLQWGKGLKAQHLDMDLSAAICFADGHREDCAYFNLVAPGAKHSGDIRNIPDLVGTAEYIELSLPELQEAGARYVAFSCNAYSHGAISPNLMVGWMNSANPMSVSNDTGVAYDPSTVQHIVRIAEGNLSKGLIFGILDVEQREITWLEMPFTSQVVTQMNTSALSSLLRRLRNKLSVGELLTLKAEAQDLTPTETPEEADESLRYTYNWALDASAVSKLLG